MPAKCLIEGCQSQSKRGGGGEWICGKHWRIVCPPRSPERRVYNRFWRLKKKYGWSPELRVRFWRFWDALKARGQRRCAGDVDVAEINKLFGWE